jgi:competence protein ComEC
LAVGLVWPPAAVVPAAGYELGLQGLLTIVDGAARTPWSWLPVDGPGTGWLSGYYGLLALALLVRGTRLARWVWRGLGLWTIGALALAAVPPPRSGLTCTFIDVGHGGAILLELPGGRTLLYDAGSFAQGDRAVQSILAMLRARRIERLDGVLLSHADADHYNGAVGLLEWRPIGGFWIPQRFLDFDQPGVVEVCTAALERGVPMGVLQAGDRLMAGETRLEVLHPRGGFADPHDNSQSLVLEVEYAGRRLLLTGDVELGGLTDLLQREPPRRIDVLQAPHHGSRRANTADLERWATPQNVIAQSREPETRDRLRTTYPDAQQVLTNVEAGSITVHISPDGGLEMSSASDAGTLPAVESPRPPDPSPR